MPAILCGALLLVAGASDVAATGDSYRLDNGLTVLLRPIDGAGQTAVVVLFDVGGDHDPSGRSGLAHLTEHLYVTAAAGDAPARDARTLVEAYPAGWNAQTGDRYTVAAGVVANDALDAELIQAAARMGDLKITDADLDREKARVVEEVGKMFGGLPDLAATNHARELVRPTPNGGRKGGVPEQVLAIRTDEVADRWRRHYKPVNAILVVAGGFDSDRTKALIAERFGPLPAGEKVPAPADPAGGATGEVRAIEVRPVVPNAASAVAVAYAAPAPRDPRYAAYLTLLARLYDGGGLLDRFLSGGVQVIAPVLDDPAAAAVSGAVKPGESAEAAAARLDAHVAGAIAGDVKPGESDRVRRRFAPLFGPTETSPLFPNVYAAAFSAGRRRQLGLDEARLSASLDEVTDDDLRRVADEVFGPDRRGAAVVTVPPR